MISSYPPHSRRCIILHLTISNFLPQRGISLWHSCLRTEYKSNLGCLPVPIVYIQQYHSCTACCASPHIVSDCRPCGSTMEYHAQLLLISLLVSAISVHVSQLLEQFSTARGIVVPDHAKFKVGHKAEDHEDGVGFAVYHCTIFSVIFCSEERILGHRYLSAERTRSSLCVMNSSLSF